LLAGHQAPVHLSKNNLKTLGQYALVIILSLLILTWIMKLWRADLHVPFTYFGDSMLYSIAVKGTIEHGWWIHNPSLGAPAGLNYEAYPAMENFHFALLKLITVFTSDYALVLNLFYLLTFPLTAITSYYFFRYFSFSFAPSLAVSLLYAFLPYHFFRMYHLLMAAYYLVPLIVLVMVWIALGEQFLIHRSEHSRWPRFELKSHKAIFSVVVCVIMGSCGVYYPYFSCFLILIAGLIASWNQRRISALLTALVLVGLIGATVVVNHLPTIKYQRAHGSIAVGSRSVADAEIMGLKITQLLLPIGGHRLDSLNALKYRYNLGPLVNENDTASLGFVGAIGFLVLIGALFSRREVPALIDRVSRLNLAAFLLATIGGFGVLFALLVSAQIRAYNRISVFIAFFSLIAIAQLLDALSRKLPAPRLRVIYYVGVAVIVVAGVLDQTSTIFFFVPDYQKITREYRSDAEFISQVEASLPANAMVFQLPYMAFPESPPLHNMLDHEHIKAYAHSKTLRWSYGVAAGETEDSWQRTVAGQPVRELVENVRAKGFAGIYLNRAAYDDHGAMLESDLSSVLGIQPIVSREGNLVFYKLAP
jgi:phosphoglycerol transferase